MSLRVCDNRLRPSMKSAECQHHEPAIEIHIGIRQRRPFGRAENSHADQNQADDGEEKARRHS